MTPPDLAAPAVARRPSPPGSPADGNKCQRPDGRMDGRTDGNFSDGRTDFFFGRMDRRNIFGRTEGFLLAGRTDVVGVQKAQPLFEELRIFGRHRQMRLEK